MILGTQSRTVLALLLAGSALQGCGGSGLNVLAAIDGPYVPPSERAQRPPATADFDPPAPAEAPAETAAELAIPTLEPQEAVALGVEKPVVELALAPVEEPAAEPEPVLALPEVPANTAAEGAVIAEAAPEPPAEDALVTAFPDLEVEELPAEAPALASAAEDTPPALSSAETATLVAAEPPAIAPEQAPEITEPALSSVGPGFLPADLPAPSTPIPASVSTAFIGPVLSRDDEQPVQLATRLPSAFDYTAPAAAPAPAREPEVQVAELAPVATPAPEPEPDALAVATQEPADLQGAAGALGYAVVSALPSPEAQPATPRAGATGSRGWAYLGFYQFALSKLEQSPAGGSSESMLLLDPPSLDPELQTCGNLPPAVLIDLDPANGLLPLLSSNRTSPELAGYLADLRQRGITINWISGQAPNAAGRIRERLTQSGLDPDGIDPLIVTRFAGESKQERRYALGESNCLLAILGDHRGDFDELYDFVLDPIMAGPLEVHIGDGWFIAPPPLD